MSGVGEHKVKRLRIIAGPNGSGKTTLYNYLLSICAFHSYYHINPDVMARDLPVSLDFTNWPVGFSRQEVNDFLDRSSFQEHASEKFSHLINIEGKTIALKNQNVSDITYLAAALADFIREKMLVSGSSFSFESVFSHESKIAILKTAKEAGYKTYLYIVNTETPEINMQRVCNRVKRGGHDVPVEKIKERYFRTMRILREASRIASRTYFFDNSAWKDAGPFQFFAEVRDGELLVEDPGKAPRWFGEYFI
jgi:predicted ABC-type ATPase